MLTKRNWIVFYGMLATAIFPNASSAQAVPFSDERWKIAGDSSRVENYQGRQTLRMVTGTAERPDLQLEDGTIDVDVMVSRQRSFVYVHFRAQGDGEYEEFYLRPHKSTLPDAVQYAPVYQGRSAWQLYHGARGTAAPAIEPDTWHRLRIVLSGPRAAFFLGDTVKPFLVLPHLARDPRPGYITLRSFVPPGTAGSGSTRFSNLSVRPGVVAYDFAKLPALPAPPEGIVSTWEVGEPFAAPDTALSAISAEWTKRFTRVPMEPEGFVQLHRHLKMPTVQRYVGTVARFRVIAQAAGVRRLDLGFSDRVTAFLNGEPIFHRDDSYDFENRRDGLISLDQAAVYLPLRAGINDVSLIVTDRFGGWAVMGRFPDMRGLRVE
jgi:hypothetical protein